MCFIFPGMGYINVPLDFICLASLFDPNAHGNMEELSQMWQYSIGIYVN